MLIELQNVETIKTRELLGLVLKELNEDNRVKFFVTRGAGASTVQCLRVMLSRVRNNLKRKGLRQKRFTLHASVFKSTGLNGERLDCVILWRSRTDDHDVLEFLERMISDGQASKLD